MRNRSDVNRRWLEGHRVAASLDAACGLGVYLTLLAAYSDRVFGAKVVHPPSYPNSGREGRRKPPLVCMTLEAAAFHSASFDFVICIEMLEHVRNDVSTVHELLRMLKPAGIHVLSVTFRGLSFKTHGIRLGSRNVNSLFGLGFPLLMYFLRTAHKYFATVRVYSASNLRRLHEGCGFRIRRIRFLLSGSDVFKRKYGSRALGQLLRRGLETLQTRLSHVWESTIVVIGEVH
jgi:SAM-dependent methyltransferase